MVISLPLCLDDLSEAHCVTRTLPEPLNVNSELALGGYSPATDFPYQLFFNLNIP